MYIYCICESNLLPVCQKLVLNWTGDLIPTMTTTENKNTAFRSAHLNVNKQTAYSELVFCTLLYIYFISKKWILLPRFNVLRISVIKMPLFSWILLTRFNVLRISVIKMPLFSTYKVVGLSIMEV